MNKLQRVLIMAGGTGGHIFPGLAIAKRLQKNGIEVVWMGTRQGQEAKLVSAASIPIHFISISGVRGKGMKDILLAPWRLTAAIWQSLHIIRKLKPDVVLGMGGFVSGPGGIACWLLRRNLIIHEQNAKPGTTNRWLARLAKKVMEGFPDTFNKRQNVEMTGNPVRQEISSIAAPALRFQGRPRPLHLLVLGGSSGAAAINRLVPEALAKLSDRPEVRHQTGEKHIADTMAAYQQAGVSAEVLPFINEMDRAYLWADIVLCRAGASTVAELCAVGLGAILVPFPYAIDDHQTANANFMAKDGAALLLQERDLTADKLAGILREFITSPGRCETMAQAAYQLRRVDAADKVLTICEEVYR